MILSLSVLARVLGGEIRRHQVLAPGPGHSPKDRSLWVRLSPDAPDGILCGSFASDDWRDCKDHVKSRLGLGFFEPSWPTPRPEPRLNDDEETRHFDAAALQIWAKAGMIGGTLAERYLREVRGLVLDKDLSPRVIRFHPRCPFGKEGEGEQKKTVYLPAMICLYRDIRTDSPRAIHRTALTPDAQKIDRLTLGPIGGAAIKLDADEDVEQGHIIGEGVETCLTARQLGLRPVWAMGPVGGIERFPVLPGLDGLTLLAEAGEPSQKAIQACGTRWDNAGRTVIIRRSRAGSDLNDALRELAR